MLVDLDVEVNVIEKNKNILPQLDYDVREKIKSILEAREVEFYLESQFTTNITNDSTIDFKINEKEEVTVDKVIVSIGRESLINEIGLANTSIKYDNGFIKTNEFYQTDESHIYAIGDCIGGLQLAHVASAEGRVAAERSEEHTSEFQSRGN